MGVFIKKSEEDIPIDNGESKNIPEVRIISSEIIPIPEAIIKSLCKIVIGKKLSSGFLIKLFRGNDDFFCLMTNEHVIKNNMIRQNQKIIFYYNNQSKRREIYLNSEERIIKEFTDINIDATVIEIIPRDKISKKYFLLPNIDYMDNYKDLINKDITIIQYPGGKMSYSHGKIVDINNYEITHTASTESGSSGSPLFIKDVDKVIGIHTGGITNKTNNFADSIGPIFNYFANHIKNKIEHENGEHHTGETSNDFKKGKGILYYKNGNIKYDGDFINDKFEGNGKYIWKNGEYYIGQWKNNLMNGKGIIYYKNGNIKYDGDFINDEYEGEGKYIYEDGDYYIGQFKNSLRHGKGILYHKNGNIKYEGDFINDKFEGDGKYILENGEYYIGQWKNNLMNGKGIYFYNNGRIMYEGDFINNIAEGCGKYYNKTGEYYIGKTKNGLKHGKGVEYYKNGNKKYDGEFVNDKAEGIGIYFYIDGDYYIGEFKEGLKNGKGIEYYKDGNIKYDGYFTNGNIVYN